MRAFVVALALGLSCVGTAALACSPVERPLWVDPATCFCTSSVMNDVVVGHIEVEGEFTVLVIDEVLGPSAREPGARVYVAPVPEPTAEAARVLAWTSPSGFTAPKWSLVPIGADDDAMMTGPFPNRVAPCTEQVETGAFLAFVERFTSNGGYCTISATRSQLDLAPAPPRPPEDCGCTQGALTSKLLALLVVLAARRRPAPAPRARPHPPTPHPP